MFDGARAPIERHGVLATLELPLGERSTLGLGLGGDIAGEIDLGARRFHLGPGWAASMSFSYRVADGTGSFPLFVLLSGALSASGTVAREDVAGARSGNLFAIDVKGGVSVGKTFARIVSPYLAFRVFGGPVFWDAASGPGTDAYHVQPAAGVVLALGRRLALFGEVAPVAERGVSAGASVGF